MHRRLVIAFLLALLLPLSQLAAAAHEVSHVRPGDKSAPASIHCDMCAVAAAVSGGAATAQPPVLAHAPAASDPPAAAATAAPRLERVALFLSRAPPFLR